MTQINYEKLIGQWHLDRNLIEGSTDKDQYMKLIHEVGELSDSSVSYTHLTLPTKA